MPSRPSNSCHQCDVREFITAWPCQTLPYLCCQSLFPQTVMLSYPYAQIIRQSTRTVEAMKAQIRCAPLAGDMPSAQDRKQQCSAPVNAPYLSI